MKLTGLRRSFSTVDYKNVHRVNQIIEKRNEYGKDVHTVKCHMLIYVFQMIPAAPPSYISIEPRNRD